MYYTNIYLLRFDYGAQEDTSNPLAACLLEKDLMQSFNLSMQGIFHKCFGVHQED